MKDFRVRELAALLLALCVLSELRVTALMRDVRYEWNKYISVATRAGRTNAGDRAIAQYVMELQCTTSVETSI